MKYVIRDSESGIFLDEYASEEEAKRAVKSYELLDRKDGVYVPNAYEISEE